MGVALAIAAAATSAVTAVGSAYMQHRASTAALREQTDIANTQNAQNITSQQAAIRNQVRQQRIRAGQIAQASANTGTQGSSGEIGGISAMDSQIDTNIASERQNAYTQNAITSMGNQAAEDQSQAATWGSIGNLAGQSANIFGNTPGVKNALTKLFS